MRAGRTAQVTVTYRWIPSKVVTGLHITNGSMGSYRTGQEVSWQLRADGGTPPYRFWDYPFDTGRRETPDWLRVEESGRVSGVIPSSQPAGVVSFHVWMEQADGRRSPYTGAGRRVTLTITRTDLPPGALTRLPPAYDDVMAPYRLTAYSVNWSNPDQLHYFTDPAGRLMVVGKREGSLIINRLDPATLQPIGATRSISLAGWPEWGGFYAAPDGHYYVLIGRKNLTEDDNRAVVAVRRYNAAWSLVGTAFLKGGADKQALNARGIYIPFEASAADMTLVGNRLVVHMGRLLYAWYGVHHQSNFTFEVDVPTMTASHYHYVYGWSLDASHSFAQFVAANGRHLVFIDHGDSYPRGIGMNVIPGFPQQRTVHHYDLFRFNGEGGDNFTGATVTGLISNDSGVVVVGTSIRHPNAPNGPLLVDDKPNVYAIWANPATGAHRFRWLSSFPNRGDHWLLEPRVVPVGANRYALLFSSLPREGGQWRTHYRLLDATGEVLASTSFPGLRFPSVSDPVRVRHKIYWADNGPQFEDWSEHTFLYGIDVSDPFTPVQLTGPN